jgi:hypothetical protein
MHRTERFIDKVLFGFDLRFFYLRIDLAPGKITDFPAAGSIRLQLVTPVKLGLVLQRVNGFWRCGMVDWPRQGRPPGFAANKILEICLPLETIGVEMPREVAFFISVLDNDREMERFPSSGFLEVPTDPWDLDQQEWMV